LPSSDVIVRGVFTAVDRASATGDFDTMTFPKSVWTPRLPALSVLVIGIALGVRAQPIGGATAGQQASQSKREAEGARVLDGAVDLHFHMEAPAQTGRGGQGNIAQVKMAKARGLRALVLKTHNEPTGTLAYHIRQAVPDFPLFGGIVMNLTNGGMNPAAVEYMAAHTAGAMGRVVWMPAGDTETEVKVSKTPNGPFVPVTKGGKLTPEVMAVLGVIAKDNRLVLATGHILAEEVLMLLTEAKRQGVQHMIATHAMDIYPGDVPKKMTIPQMQEAAKLGAIIEFDFRNIFHDNGVRADAIRAIGAEHCFISEFWTKNNPREYGELGATGDFVEKMKAKGFTDRDLDLMFKVNPAKLLGLGTPGSN
jgi:hypothetical protein